MLNVLMPTDFTPASIKLVEQAIKNSDKKINVILFHAFLMSDSEFDLLTQAFRKTEAMFMTEAFRLSCKQLKDAYPQIINKISVKCMHGSTNVMFRNFVEGNDIDFICCPVGYNYFSIHKYSLNPLPMFKKAGIPQLKEVTTTKEYAFNSKIIFNNELERA